MKIKIHIFRLIVFLFFFLFASSSLNSQNINKQDSLICIQKIKYFLISNPPPYYIVEIRNDRTITFYNILPENSARDYSELLGAWILDSTTIKIESSEFLELEKIVLSQDLKNIGVPKKRESKDSINIMRTGDSPDNYSIETTFQNAKFSYSYYDRDISDSIIAITTIFEVLEEKYKPN